MLNLDIIEEGLTRMRPEENFALEWLGTSSISLATQIDEIYRVYAEKLADREVAKGKGKVVDHNDESPTASPRAFTIEMRQVQALSSFEAEFIDLNPEASPSNRRDVEEITGLCLNFKARLGLAYFHR
nr:ribosomal RNA processing protein 36 homolog [Ipomoea batatas]